ncbi:MAG TPA: hypothetical protein VHG71_12005 [Verrucomicrobiae bacterium]|nr:hypothetical protein [Verrucomicrobiae bacterium]
MKLKKDTKQITQLTPDSENRLYAYATAASLGAFFVGQSVEAQVVESTALAPYPHTLIKGVPPAVGYYGTYFYIDVDGDGTPDLNLNVDTFRVNIDKAIGTQTNQVLNPSSNGYVIPWTVGTTLDSTTGSVPTYKKWLASSAYDGGWVYFFNNFTNEEALGFSFTASDGLTHFGYMNVQVNHTSGDNNDFTATVAGVYYNKTPNAGIVIGSVPPAVVTITSIHVGSDNSVTINFTSSDNAPASAFTLETSPALGPAASWTADGGAVVSSGSPGLYQAVTISTGGPAQFYRISH